VLTESFLHRDIPSFQTDYETVLADLGKISIEIEELRHMVDEVSRPLFSR